MSPVLERVKITIRNRWTNAAIYTHEATAERQASGLAMQDALEAAVKSGANLSDAYLSGAKWRDGIVITKAPIQLSGLCWFVTILDAHMQIGCELHSLAEWSAFDDRRIAAMDGRDALRFWRESKDALLMLAREHGRSFDAPVVTSA